MKEKPIGPNWITALTASYFEFDFVEQDDYVPHMVAIPQEERSFVALICYLIYLDTLKLLKSNFFIFLSSYSFLISVNNFQPTGRILNGKNDL